MARLRALIANRKKDGPCNVQSSLTPLSRSCAPPIKQESSETDSESTGSREVDSDKTSTGQLQVALPDDMPSEHVSARSEAASLVSARSTRSVLSDEDTLVVDVGCSSELDGFSYRESFMDDYSHRSSGVPAKQFRCTRDRPGYSLPFLLSLRYVRNSYQILEMMPNCLRKELLLEHMPQDAVLQFRKEPQRNEPPNVAKPGTEAAPATSKKAKFTISHVEELDVPKQCIVKMVNLSMDIKWQEVETFAKHKVGMIPKTVRMCRRQKSAFMAFLVFNTAEEAHQFVASAQKACSEKPKKFSLKGRVPFFEAFHDTVAGFSLPPRGETRSACGMEVQEQKSASRHAEVQSSLREQDRGSGAEALEGKDATRRAGAGPKGKACHRPFKTPDEQHHGQKQQSAGLLSSR
eukprot:429432-Rhodomonas_salina.3